MATVNEPLGSTDVDPSLSSHQGPHRTQDDEPKAAPMIAAPRETNPGARYFKLRPSIAEELDKTEMAAENTHGLNAAPPSDKVAADYEAMDESIEHDDDSPQPMFVPGQTNEDFKPADMEPCDECRQFEAQIIGNGGHGRLHMPHFWGHGTLDKHQEHSTTGDNMASIESTVASSQKSNGSILHWPGWIHGQDGKNSTVDAPTASRQDGASSTQLQAPAHAQTHGCLGFKDIWPHKHQHQTPETQRDGSVSNTSQSGAENQDDTAGPRHHRRSSLHDVEDFFKEHIHMPSVKQAISPTSEARQLYP